MSNVIEGVLCYAKVQSPSKKYQSEVLEFSVDIVVDKATAKAFSKKYPKQKHKEIDTSEFEEKYKIEPPFPDEEEQFIIKIKRPGSFKDGAEVPEKYWPKVLLQEGNSAVPLERDRLVANGSKGKVSFEENTNDFGTFARLKAILITDLIEYKSAAGGDAAADFGLKTVHKGAEDFDEEKPEKVVKKTSAKKPPKSEEPEDDSDSSPF